MLALSLGLFDLQGLLSFIIRCRYLTCKIFLSATCTLEETDKYFSHKLLLYFAFFVKWVKSTTYLRNARVSLDFDILIESFISLCIIEMVRAIFREYKPWIVLLITH
jgi:hypothetical protein